LSKRPIKSEKTPKGLANHEIVVVAAFLAGAQAESADTEDIAVKANGLAPGRFSWRKYKDQINIDSVRKRLWDATKPEKGGYLIGSERTGWRLTKAGYDFARQHMKKDFGAQPKKERASLTERSAQTREIKRMLMEVAFQKYIDAQLSTVTKHEAERFFRIDDYVTGKTRVAKIERFRIMASTHKKLSGAIDSLAKIVTED
jgi:hypothetical protein